MSIKPQYDADDRYSYHVRAVDVDDFRSEQTLPVSTWGISPQIHTDPATAGAKRMVPKTFDLQNNAPNPVRDATTIRYALPEPAPVTLTVYDVRGREVARLYRGERPAGFHDVRLDASDLPSGVYLYRITAGAFTETKRLVVVR